MAYLLFPDVDIRFNIRLTTFVPSHIEILCPYSLSGRTSYCKISWSLGATRLVVVMIVSLWYSNAALKLMLRKILQLSVTSGNCLSYRWPIDYLENSALRQNIAFKYDNRFWQSSDRQYVKSSESNKLTLHFHFCHVVLCHCMYDNVYKPST